MTVVAATLLVWVGCSSQDGAPAAPPAPAEPAARAPTAPTGPSPVTRGASTAFFEGEDLSSCLESSVTLTPREGTVAEDRIAALEAMLRRTDEPEDESVVHLTRSCAEQFAGRQIFARCTETASEEGEGATVAMRHVVSYYDFGQIFDDDQKMRRCLRRGGEWWSMPETSREYELAQAEHELQRAQRALKRYR